ncbi:MAG TPA: FAD/NAD(P)-binding protein [Candidatus Dormibacteraeota bacterium]|nr:FAD/NAD(P)-binding protein [Candidatus Dormibacteraeota bacterium]
MTPYALHPARIVARHDETPTIATFTLRFLDAGVRRAYRFALGQFNMVYAYGVGEVPISIVSDPEHPEHFDHIIRRAGRVTTPMLAWKVGDTVGVRGPYGVGWPIEAARGHDVIIVTGGLGCAPVVGVINHIFRHRAAHGDLQIVHGVKTPHDLLYRERFDAWRDHPRTRVFLTTDQPDRAWRYHSGVVTELFDELTVTPSTIVMMCGPEVMMHHAARLLTAQGVAADALFVSIERNMQCGIGLCGHCQLGPHFACKDGPVFPWNAVRPWLAAEAR